MIKRRGKSIRATAIALIHANHIHARRQALRRNRPHVLRVAGAFESVDDDDGQRILTRRPPVTVAQNPDAGLDIDASFFGWRNSKTPWQKETCQSLDVAAAQMTPRNKSIELRIPHKFILME